MIPISFRLGAIFSAKLGTLYLFNKTIGAAVLVSNLISAGVRFCRKSKLGTITASGLLGRCLRSRNN